MKRTPFSSEDITSQIHKHLNASFRGVTERKCALMFSGGFDSLLLAVLMRDFGIRVTAITVQFENFNPLTVSEAAALACEIDLPHHIIVVSLHDFLSAFQTLPGFTDRPLYDLDLVLVSAAFKNYRPGTTGRSFVTGMGSDQWFGDRGFEQASMDEDAHHQVAAAYNYKFVFPFLSDQMKSLSRQIPPNLKKDKQILRQILPEPYRKLHKSPGVREVQVPLHVRRLLLKIHDCPCDGDYDESSLRTVIRDIWSKQHGSCVKSSRGRKERSVSR